MSLLDNAREAAARAVDEGRVRADDLRRRRERSKLLGELGEACYRQVKGNADASADIERLVVMIDDLGIGEVDEADVDLRETAGKPDVPEGHAVAGTDTVRTP